MTFLCCNINVNTYKLLICIAHKEKIMLHSMRCVFREYTDIEYTDTVMEL